MFKLTCLELDNLEKMGGWIFINFYIVETADLFITDFFRSGMIYRSKYGIYSFSLSLISLYLFEYNSSKIDMEQSTVSVCSSVGNCFLEKHQTVHETENISSYCEKQQCH